MAMPQYAKAQMTIGCVALLVWLGAVSGVGYVLYLIATALIKYNAS